MIFGGLYVELKVYELALVYTAPDGVLNLTKQSVEHMRMTAVMQLKEHSTLTSC